MSLVERYHNSLVPASAKEYKYPPPRAPVPASIPGSFRPKPKIIESLASIALKVAIKNSNHMEGLGSVIYMPKLRDPILASVSDPEALWKIQSTCNVPTSIFKKHWERILSIGHYSMFFKKDPKIPSNKGRGRSWPDIKLYYRKVDEANRRKGLAILQGHKKAQEKQHADREVSICAVGSVRSINRVTNVSSSAGFGSVGTLFANGERYRGVDGGRPLTASQKTMRMIKRAIPRNNGPSRSSQLGQLNPKAIEALQKQSEFYNKSHRTSQPVGHRPSSSGSNTSTGTFSAAPAPATRPTQNNNFKPKTGILSRKLPTTTSSPASSKVTPTTTTKERAVEPTTKSSANASSFKPKTGILSRKLPSSTSSSATRSSSAVARPSTTNNGPSSSGVLSNKSTNGKLTTNGSSASSAAASRPSSSSSATSTNSTKRKLNTQPTDSAKRPRIEPVAPALKRTTSSTSDDSTSSAASLAPARPAALVRRRSGPNLFNTNALKKNKVVPEKTRRMLAQGLFPVRNMDGISSGQSE